MFGSRGQLFIKLMKLNTTFAVVRRMDHACSLDLRRFGVIGQPEARRLRLRFGLLGDFIGRYGYGYAHGGVGVIGLILIVIVVLIWQGPI
ncbi:hypothetical protein B1812_08845 [Methylocystis bryophila]|uniref:Uncharacterized protein n=1 Tax=Methylocystis bryophila TaxID=655015 RepID=A0A1W6MUD7_9HYPH|nr:hypothetical protein B1812_08845 [Methylocystis bryophila]